MARASKKVETFSVGFELREGEQTEKFNADFFLARRTAKHFGATHHEVLLHPDEIIPLFEEAVYHLDEPIANATIIPMLKLARFAKERVAVALGGDGGDELFGGYERYRLSLLSSYYRRFPTWLRASANRVFPRAARLDTAPGIERYAQFHFLKEERIKPLLSAEAYHPHTARDFFAERFFYEIHLPFEEQFMETDRESWLPDESLLRADKMSMSAGLEARVPLLDLSLVALADTIPLAHKVSLFNTKIILKEAFRGLIPDELLHQPKRGWFSPGAKWLRYPQIAAFAREVLSPDYAEATRALFNWDAVRTRLEAHLRGEYHLTELWAILTLQVWARRFKMVA
jgi:asparagine synthase (glutamine-hydrolysing)